MGAKSSAKGRDADNELSNPDLAPLTTKQRILLGELSAEELLSACGLTGETLRHFDDQGDLATRQAEFIGDEELLETMEGPTELIGKICAEAASRMIELDQSTERDRKFSQRDSKEALIRDAGEVVTFTLAIDTCLEADRIDVGQALDLAVKLGMAYQRMVVRDAEKYVKRGVKSTKGARSGHSRVHGTEEEKKERWQQMTDLFQELVDKGESKMEAYKAVAKHSGYCTRTVQEAIKKMGGGG